MPIYAYRCEGCGFQKDALQKFSDPPLVDCPQCGEPRLAKQLTAAGFALKGTGWYATDFRDSGKKSEKKSDTTETAAPSSTTAAPAPATPAAPTPPVTTASGAASASSEAA